MAHIFCIYADSGATFEFLRESLQPYKILGLQTRLVMRDDIVHRNALTPKNDNVVGFFLPGNASGQRYRDDLGSETSQIIKQYVANGGAIAGLCAGGYLLTENVDYQSTNRKKNMPSELGFFHGTAYGQLPLLEKVDGARNGWQHAAVTSVTYDSLLDGRNTSTNVLYWGGACLLPEEPVDIIATYDAYQHPGSEKPGIAVAAKNYGTGRAVFSGVHPEISTRVLQDSAAARSADHDDGTFRQNLVQALRAGPRQHSTLFQAVVGEMFKSANGRQFLTSLQQERRPQKAPKHLAGVFS